MNSFSEDIHEPPTKLGEQLYLGNIINANNHVWLEKTGITHILDAGFVTPLYAHHRSQRTNRGPSRIKGQRFSKDDLNIKDFKIHLRTQAYLDSLRSDHEVKECLEDLTKYRHTSVKYFSFTVEDSLADNISDFFAPCIHFLDTVFQNPTHKVLVHCAMGISRSPTIVAVYLMARMGRSLDEALKFIESRRVIIEPNTNFISQLHAWEIRLTDPEVKELKWNPVSTGYYLGEGVPHEINLQTRVSFQLIFPNGETKDRWLPASSAQEYIHNLKERFQRMVKDWEHDS